MEAVSPRQPGACGRGREREKKRKRPYLKLYWFGHGYITHWVLTAKRGKLHLGEVLTKMRESGLKKYLLCLKDKINFHNLNLLYFFLKSHFKKLMEINWQLLSNRSRSSTDTHYITLFFSQIFHTFFSRTFVSLW